MKDILKNIDFNGAVYHVKNGQTEQYYHGFQEITKQHIITENTQFNLASLSKMYTAVMTF